jgi:3-oxoacyl-[acyl-carrier-protein] synthase-3
VDTCAPDDTVLSQFRYPAAKAQHVLELEKASSIALSQQGCCGLLSGIDMAEKMLSGSEAQSAILLAGDAFSRGSTREIIYNLMSDASAAVLIEKDAEKNRIVNFHQHSVPYFWDTPKHTNEILASYFPLAQRVIVKCLEQAGMTTSDVTWFVPHNVNLRSWHILTDLLDVPMSRVWSRNISRVGHTVSCDHVINLRDMENDGVLNSNDILVLFTFGFGANWSCMILEH